MPTKAEQVADAVFSAMEKLDDDKVEKLYADDARIWHSFDNKVMSKADILNNIRQMRQFATLSFKVYDRVATDDLVVQRCDTIVHAEGQPDKVIPTAIFIRVRDGLIVEVHEFMESTQI